MNGPRGYIKLARKLFADDPYWSEARVFSRFEAWVYLLARAQFKRRTFNTKYGPITLERGELVASVRKLAERFQWSKNKVHHFLRTFEKQGRLSGQRKGQFGIVYLVVNYDTYQGRTSDDGTLNGTPNGTPAGHLRDKKEEGKKQVVSKDQLLPAADAATRPKRVRRPKPATTPSDPTPTDPATGAPAPPPVAEMGGSWPARLAVIWTREVGAVEIPRLAARLKPVVDVHGEEAVALGIVTYATAMRGRATKLEWFAESASTYCAAEPRYVDDFGCLTPHGLRQIAAHVGGNGRHVA